jgi:hypothetical protein
LSIDLSIAAGEIPPPIHPETLYHYTSLSGFRKIIASASLYASDVWYMNDRGEGTFGRRCIRKYLAHRAEESPLDKQFSEAVMSMLSNVEGKVDDGELHNCYIACLSAKEDQLSQWRGYGGVAIGFDHRALIGLSASLADPYKFSIRKVAYKREEQCSLIQARSEPLDLSKVTEEDDSEVRANASAFFSERWT